MTWRSRAAHHLAPLIEPARRLIEDGKLGEARVLIRDAYPFGLREYTPYKIWCEEVRRMIPGLYPARKTTAPPPGAAPLPMDEA